MARYKITLEYDGSRYAGWQLQKGERTVQGACFDACKKAFPGKKFEFYGSGRTDAGVHALEQVAHLEVETELVPQKLQYALNDQLPYDINILLVEPASARFHARYDATARSYIYLISHRRSAFGKGNIWWVKDALSIEKMNRAARLLQGLKDFRSFTDPEAETESTKVDVHWVDVLPMGDLTAIHVVGSHFLWKMVRRMVGVIVEAGRGKLQPAEIESFFTTHSPGPARLTAPPSGLYLDKIYYQNQQPLRGREIVPQILRLR